MCYGETLSAAIVRARKTHGCDECSRAIAPGQRYFRNTTVDHGEFGQVKLCRTCYLAVSQGNEACWEIGGDGDARDALRSTPWRETLAWMRAAWKRARGIKTPTPPTTHD